MNTKIEDITISDLDRESIACPATWSGETLDGGRVYIRFRGGLLSLRHRKKEEGPLHESDKQDDTYVSREREIFRDNSFDPLDGHMDVFQLTRHLRQEGFKFTDFLDNSFYGGLQPEDCHLTLVGDWFVSAMCCECEWMIDQDSAEEVEYETVIPKNCPDCGADLEVQTEEPERLKRLSRDQ